MMVSTPLLFLHRLLYQEGYTVRGVQKLLRQKDVAEPETPAPQPAPSVAPHDEPAGVDVFRLIALRNRLADAIES